MIQLFKHTFWIVLFGLLLAQCGTRGSPSGGEKDITPPKVEEYSPNNKTTNFQGNRIEIEFDEYVKVSSFYKEFVVSPPIAEQPKYKLKGKTLILDFDSSFAENTTYTLFFGDAISDITEGNKWDNNQYVFSTGDIIDSLSYSGEVFDAETMKGVKDGKVHLYKMDNDSAPAKEIPSYFAKIKNGKFKFENLAAGDYKIFALSDANGNYLYDLPNEPIAFQTDLIKVEQKEEIVHDSTDTLHNHHHEVFDQSEVQLMMFTSNKKKQGIASYESDKKGKVAIKFNQSVTDFSIEILDMSFKKDWRIDEWNESIDSLTIWSEELMRLDTFKLEVKYNGLVDTLSFKMFKRAYMNEIPLEAKTSFTDLANYFKKPLSLFFNQPVSSYDSSKVCLLSETDTVPAGLSQSQFLLQLDVNNELEPESKYWLVFEPSALTSVFGDSNKDSLIFELNTAKESALSNLLFKYDFSALGSKGILEFWSEDKKKQEFYITDPKGQLSLEGLLPAKYKFKFIADENEDKKWTPGDYWEKKQPEKVYWYKDEVMIRANWDMDVEWVLIP